MIKIRYEGKTLAVRRTKCLEELKEVLRRRFHLDSGQEVVIKHSSTSQSKFIENEEDFKNLFESSNETPFFEVGSSPQFSSCSEKIQLAEVQEAINYLSEEGNEDVGCALKK